MLYREAKDKLPPQRSAADKRVLSIGDSIERSVNGFIRDFKLSQFYDGLPAPSDLISLVIQDITAIAEIEKMPLCIEKLTKLRTFIGNMLDVTARINGLLSIQGGLMEEGGEIDEAIAGLISTHLPHIRDAIDKTQISPGLLSESKTQIQSFITKCGEKFADRPRKAEVLALLQQISEKV